VFRYVVLGLLRDGKPRHGYALMKAYRDQVGVQVSTGNFYRELQRLVTEGWVRTVERADGADARQAPYAITPAGAASFDEWFADTNTPPTHTASEDQLSSRILFLAEVSPEVARRLLDRWTDELCRRAHQLEQARLAAQTAAAEHPDRFPVLPILLGRRLRHVTADLALVDELRDAYESWLGEVAPVPDCITPTAPRPRGERPHPATASLLHPRAGVG
jgi:DNA-binding PadR family transcriptional regulator